MTHAALVAEFFAICDAREASVAFRETALGSRWGRNGAVEVPDVLTIAKSFTNPEVTIYEVKASRADLLSDLRSDKWERYMPACNRLSFATGEGVAKCEDIPPECGWWKRGPRGWRACRAAPKHKGGLAAQDLLSLLFAQDDLPRAQFRSHYIHAFEAHQQDRKLTGRWGHETAARLRKMADTETSLAFSQAQVEGCRKALADVLGVDVTYQCHAGSIGRLIEVGLNAALRANLLGLPPGAGVRTDDRLPPTLPR